MSTVRWSFFCDNVCRTMSKKKSEIHVKTSTQIWNTKWSWSNHSQISTHMKTPENYHPSKRYVSTTRSIELQLPRKLKAAPVNRAPQVRKPWNFLWNMMGSCKKIPEINPLTLRTCQTYLKKIYKHNVKIWGKWWSTLINIHQQCSNNPIQPTTIRWSDSCML